MLQGGAYFAARGSIAREIPWVPRPPVSVDEPVGSQMAAVAGAFSLDPVDEHIHSHPFKHGWLKKSLLNFAFALGPVCEVAVEGVRLQALGGVVQDAVVNGLHAVAVEQFIGHIHEE